VPFKAQHLELGPTRPVSITAVVDVVGALAARTMHGHLYLYDTNKTMGSVGFGTECLRTRVHKDDQILWNVVVLECETYASIDGIQIDDRICEPERKVCPGTDIACWIATIKQDLTEPAPYWLRFRLGTLAGPITTTSSSFLVGHGTGSRRSAREVTRTNKPNRDIGAEARGQLNSIQLNIVTLVNMERAWATGSLENAMYMMDNSVGGVGQGTDHLETVCTQGQVLNWIIRPIEMDKRPDGTWPPMPKIGNIVFLDTAEGDEQNVAQRRVCTELKIYGMPDLMRAPQTRIYYYWAGAILTTAPPGLYGYRLVIELEQEDPKKKLYLNTVSQPSIRVLEI
jgi:hypothetical protein